MLSITQAIILGAIQGITEFLPISSSAHLVLMPWFFKFHDPGLTFDVMLHLATAIALLIYFWKDLLRIFIAFVKTLRTRKVKTFDEKLGWFMLLGSLPAVICGLLFEDVIEAHLRNPVIIAGTLILFALVLWAAESFGKKDLRIEKIGLREVIIIGLAQVLALVPGVSRSGITMTAALFCGLKREASARFSFLLATPVIVGAGLYKLKDIVKAPAGFTDLSLIVGFISATLFGVWAIAFLLEFLKKRSFNIFVTYRILLGITIIAIALTR